MEFASRLRWILVIIFVILMLIIVGWGLYSIARNIFDPNGSSETETTEQVKTVQDARSARFIYDGPVVAHPEHRSHKIEVTSSVVSMTVYSSYGDVVLAQRSYQNTPEAYSVFLKSLEGFDVTNRFSGTDTEDDNSETGVCPTGNRYILELDNDLRRWTTSCSSNDGTADFNMNRVRALFEDQVTDFNDILKEAEQ